MKSFRDHAADILTAYGYASSNGDDLARAEPEDFNLEPGRWLLFVVVMALKQAQDEKRLSDGMVRFGKIFAF